ncbi:MAG: hypothetical protein IV100_06540 [Myxococcales bacterium]|nr:hypothetical protein [Myxococcales bacterium]
MTNEIEGVIAEVPGGRFVQRGLMDVTFARSPWRNVGSGSWTHEVLQLTVLMDVDLADAWLSSANPGDGVRADSVSFDGARGTGFARTESIRAAKELPKDGPETHSAARIPGRFFEPIPESFWEPLPEAELDAWEK